VTNGYTIPDLPARWQIQVNTYTIPNLPARWEIQVFDGLKYILGDQPSVHRRSEQTCFSQAGGIQTLPSLPVVWRQLSWKSVVWEKLSAILEPAEYCTPVTSRKDYSVEILFSIVFELDPRGRCAAEIWDNLPLKLLTENLDWLQNSTGRMEPIYLNFALPYFGPAIV